MKFGTETGSLVNHVYGSARSAPEVNGPATLLGWSDRYPATVLATDYLGKGIVVVQNDAWTVVSGSMHDGSAKYQIDRDPNGSRTFWKKNTKTGKYEGIFRNTETGRWNKNGDKGILFGRREKYEDPHF